MDYDKRSDSLMSEAAYLRGLAEGLKIGEKGDEGMIIAKLIDFVENMASHLKDTSEYVEELDDDLAALEYEVDACGEEIEELEATCAHMKHSIVELEDQVDSGDFDYDDDDDLFGVEYDDEEDDDPGYFELKCPKCNEDVLIDFDMIDSSDTLVCPNCHEDISLEFDLDDDEDEDDEEDDEE